MSNNLESKHRTYLKQKFTVLSKFRNKTVGAGFIFAIFAAAFSALPNVLPKSILIEHSVDDTIIPNPMMLVFVIYVANSLLFAPFRKSSRKTDKKTGKTTFVLLILLGLAEASGTLSYTVGLEETTATNASILVNSETVFAILLGVMIFREKIGRQEMFPLFLIVIGSILIPVTTDIYNNDWQLSDFMMGDFLIALSGFFYCLDTFIAKKLDDSIKTRHLVHVMSCTGAVMTLGLMLLFQIPFDISLEEFSLMSVVGFLGIGITMVFFVMALRLIGAVRTVLIYSTTTVFSIVYSVLVLSESITILNIVSAGSVMFGLFVLRNRISAD
ncbi:DMT family transporter [Nitrosopumilus sp. K4]|uniref:DMT family transporter n=1 Tax=Nitrosopumilus sp. K4 TaxID=2795383 RepID=UPI001BAE068E|nr:DMT family transporter [Nitrosopumilus sp. K4]QUC64091.1 DMT family transporter [Nitrosopumilus sp. K4]